MVKQGVSANVWLAVFLRPQQSVLLHSEVIGGQASVVDVQDKASVISGRIEYLKEENMH